MKTIRTTLLFSILLLPALLTAQSASAAFTVAVPRGEFEQNIRHAGFGGTLQFFLNNPAPALPFQLGASISFINYGSESRRAPFSPTIPDVTVDVDRANNIMQAHLVLRVTTTHTLLRPYADFLIGGSYLFTETKITSTDRSKEVVNSTNVDDWAWSYGAGAGVQYRVYQPKPAEESQIGPVYVDFSVRYLKGTEAEYLKEGSVVVNPGGTVTYNLSKSKTDLLNISIGALAYFNSFSPAQ